MLELSPPPVPGARLAATLVVLRDAPAGLEVLLLRRAERGDHNSGAWVFPGGVVDAGDGDTPWPGDAAASAQLGLASGGLRYVVAALRECFEESGLLYARDAQGALLHDASAFESWRAPLNRGERTLTELCDAHALTPALDHLVYLSHWRTPPGLDKLFDTRFFIAEAPAGQVATHDAGEMVDHAWLAPAEALAESRALKLIVPTRRTLQALGRFASVADALAWARSARDLRRIEPWLGRGPQGLRPVTPDEPAWAEIGRLDPEGRGDAHYDIRPGVAVRLSPRVIRVTADNGSVMTGPGTNTYLVGGGARNDWAVIDPGPADAAHLQAVLAAAPGPIRHIFVTHTHLDHSPGAQALKAATGAPLLGRVADFPEWQDRGFTPDVALAGGEVFALDGATLRVVHTPGHASNHLCFRLDEERLLFTGDHVMQLSTVVINPPDGDMAAYLASLRSLLAGDALDWLAPGHGFLMAEPRRAIEAIVAHRLKREAKVVDALQRCGPASADDLLPAVYDDVRPQLHRAALRSLTAHLLKLRDEGRAAEVADRWRLVDAG